MKNGNFSWAKLYIFKRLTEKPTENSAGPLVFAVIVIGITIFRLSCWLCAIIFIIMLVLKIFKTFLKLVKYKRIYL